MAETKAALKKDRATELKEICYNWLLKDLGAEKISIVDLLVVSELLTVANTAPEVAGILYGLSKDYPGLDAALERAAGAKQESREVDLQAIVNLVIKQDPILATEIAKVSMESGMTIEKLQDRFPQIKDYLA